MGTRIDLHLHTIASDGCWTPKQLITEVQQAGIGLFAITDHDSLGGLAGATAQMRGTGLRFLRGVELSARLNGQLHHLLAYGFDPTDPGLNSLVTANAARLAGAGDDAVRQLVAAGYAISWEDYSGYTWDRRRGGWKSINYLIDRGFCRGVRDYFDRLFVGECAHPEADFPPPEEVIAVARRAGGVVVLAHPGAAFYDGLGVERLDELVEMGIQGLECYSFHHSEAMTLRFLDYCHNRDLLITGGSDAHGGFAGRSLGVPLVHSHELRLGVLEERVIT